jgi:hypothetical protein
MQGWMLRIGSFLERAEAALDRLSLMSPVLQSTSEVCPLVVPDAGHFSPLVRDNSTGVAPVVQVMPKLQEMCGEPVVPLSDEKAKVVSLEISNEALSSHVLDFKESGDVVLPKSIGHVVPVGDVVATSSAAARVPGSLVAKEICDFLPLWLLLTPDHPRRLGVS